MEDESYGSDLGYSSESGDLDANPTTESSNQFRGFCAHGVDTVRAWKGPIRSTYEDSQTDITNHQATCQVKGCNDCEVIDPSNILW
jgi:hypothetical protein